MNLKSKRYKSLYNTHFLTKMPRNTTGGKGHKRGANGGSNFIQREYKITSELEVEAYVEKILGNGRVQVNSTDGRYTGLVCTIRGKFKGRNKSRNRIEPNGIVIIGLREWEGPTYKTCDLISVCSGRYKVVETDDDDNNNNDINGVEFTKDAVNIHEKFDTVDVNKSEIIEDVAVSDDDYDDDIDLDDI